MTFPLTQRIFHKTTMAMLTLAIAVCTSLAFLSYHYFVHDALVRLSEHSNRLFERLESLHETQLVHYRALLEAPSLAHANLIQINRELDFVINEIDQLAREAHISYPSHRLEQIERDLHQVRRLMTANEQLVVRLVEQLPTSITTERAYQSVIYQLYQEGFTRNRINIVNLMFGLYQGFDKDIDTKITQHAQRLYATALLVMLLTIGFLLLSLIFVHAVKTQLLKPIKQATARVVQGYHHLADIPTSNPECRYLFSKLESQFALIQSLKRQAEKNAREKSDFLHTMSHEIRSPLNAILGGIELLFNHKHPLAKPHIEDMKAIQTAGHFLLSVVNDILTLAKVNHSATEGASSQRIELIDFCHTLSSVFRVDRNAPSSQVFFYVAPNMPMAFYSDERRLQQIIINIVVNALKYAHSSVIRVRLFYDTSSHTLSVRIVDFGKGIPKEAQKRIFNPYVQLSPAANVGTGLGLAISQKLVVQLHGRFSLVSRLGQGSYFRIDVPASTDNDSMTFTQWHSERQAIVPLELSECARPYLHYHFRGSYKVSERSIARRVLSPFEFFTPLDNPLHRQPVHTSLPRLKYLVAEDFELNIILLKKMAQNDDLDFTFVTDGLQALEELKRQPYDVILMDVQMPVMDGIEATRQIRRYPEYNQLPIIGLTAHIQEETNQQCLQAGMDAVLSKPFRLQELQETVFNLLSHRSLIELGSAPSP